MMRTFASGDASIARVSSTFALLLAPETIRLTTRRITKRSSHASRRQTTMITAVQISLPPASATIWPTRSQKDGSAALRGRMDIEPILTTEPRMPGSAHRVALLGAQGPLHSGEVLADQPAQRGDVAVCIQPRQGGVAQGGVGQRSRVEAGDEVLGDLVGPGLPDRLERGEV